MINLKVPSILPIDCQKTGADLFHRKVKSQKVERSFFPKDLLKLMDQNPEFYFGSKIIN